MGVEESVAKADMDSSALPEELCEELALLVALGEEWPERVLEALAEPDALAELEALAVLVGESVKSTVPMLSCAALVVVVSVAVAVDEAVPVEVEVEDAAALGVAVLVVTVVVEE